MASTKQVPGLAPALVIDGRIATITLRRPAVANRLELSDLHCLREQVRQVNSQAEVLVLRLAAQGRHFCSGFNIGNIGDGAAQEGGTAFEALASEIEQARPVTVAAIQGGVYGGASDLALSCDFRIGTPVSELIVPAAKLGILFYRGGLERYVSRLGLGVVKRIMLAADKLDSAEMLAVGFLDRLAPSVEELMPAVDGFSTKLAAMAPLALLGMKKHINAIALNRLDAEAFARDIAVADASADLLEGALAWQEKRAPLFKGR